EGWEGLAAVRLQQGQIDEAGKLAQRVLAVKPDSPGANVVFGKLYLSEGRLSEAQQSFDLAAKAEDAPSWIRAEAYGGLGRIAAAKKDNGQALNEYDKALANNPDQQTITINKAVLLEREGKYEDAAKLYEKAAAANPQDNMAARLLKNALNRTELVNDQEKQKKIDQLVSELLIRQNELSRSGANKSYDQDAWTSRPLTICLLGFEVGGNLSARDGQGEYLNLLLTQRLSKISRIKLVDRAVLDKLMEELKLGTSNLADPNAALRLGRILASRLLLSGKIMTFKDHSLADVRLIDVETSAINGVVQQTITGDDPASMVGVLARELESAIYKHYPIRGRVNAVKDQVVELNIGAAAGLQSGTSLYLFGDSGIAPTGNLLVTQVNEKSTQAKIIGGGKEIKSGMRVEQTLRAEPWPDVAKGKGLKQ
ncbi:MAG: tetratricopeptide repeat protein, partial [Deltaproteobacteria bacterium]|nr:tetratricopeptide repeat protein [Deltaproteobacteria bacterium]